MRKISTKLYTKADCLTDDFITIIKEKNVSDPANYVGPRTHAISNTTENEFERSKISFIFE